MRVPRFPFHDSTGFHVSCKTNRKPEANLEKLFVALTSDFYEKTSDITTRLKKLPAEDHSVIWSSLFEIEKDARSIRDKLASDFRLHAEIIKMCFDDLNKPMNSL